MAFCILGNHSVHPIGTACPAGNMPGQTRFQTAAALAAAQAAQAVNDFLSTNYDVYNTFLQRVLD